MPGSDNIIYGKYLKEASFLINVLDQARDIILVVDTYKNILYANQAAVDAYGYSVDELKTLKIQDLRAKETLAVMDEQYEIARSKGTLFRTMHVRRNGERFPVEVSSRTTEFPGEDGVVSIIRDITEIEACEKAQQKSDELTAANEELATSEEELRTQYEELYFMEESLKISNEKLSLAAELAQLGPWEYDPVKNIFEFDDELYSIYGTSVALEGRFMAPDEFVKEFVHPDDARIVKMEMDNLVLRTEPTQLEHRIIRRDGEARTILVRINVIKDDAGKIVRIYGTNQDITDRVNAEKKLRRQNEYFTLLHQLSTGLLNQLDLDELLESLLTRACELFCTTDGSIYWVNETRGLVEMKIDVGRNMKSTSYTLNIGQGVVGKVAQSGQPLVVEDYQNWPEHVADPLWDRLYTCVGIPLKPSGKVIGVIGLNFFDHSRSFSIEELDFLSRFAELISIALDNATLVAAYKNEIQDRKQIEAKLRVSEDKYKKLYEESLYLSLHDALTGLYNRAFFEEEMKRIAGSREQTAGMMVCDVDGLKLINDTLGHKAGDLVLKAVATILMKSFRPDDIVARIGGDEYAVILHHNLERIFEENSRKISEKINTYNIENPTVPISLSMGFAVSRELSVDMGALFKEADNSMYREKLHRYKSSRSAIVQTLMKTLEARDVQTEGHSNRMQELVSFIANALGMPDKYIADLRLLARFHDVGKVGIPDNILLKPGRLTEEEIIVMRQHCEIGYRIARSAPDLTPIADWILKHQEWWDGNGYPLGISGEQIPLECRILTIADAYDAMTSDRPYRKAMSHEAALNELTRCAGTQFDPKLVGLFVAMQGNLTIYS